MKEGYIHIYTGEGKGKTTAALGQGLRAVGNGLKVIMVQFLKGGASGELVSTKAFKDNFKIIRLVESNKFFWNLSEEEKTNYKKELDEKIKIIYEIITEEKCDILILDEVFLAISKNIIDLEELTNILDIKPKTMEIILTGRNAPEEIISRGDLVTRMEKVKHYYDKGIKSREGIEY